MAVYFITGKLGAGKTLCAVGRIQDCLRKGLPIATNLDLEPYQLLSPWKKNTRIMRVPDKPSIEDLEFIGVGNDSYDESKNGLLVLDECGTWFNSRSWNDKGRQAIINWMLHARKLGWDILFIIQDISIVDKQAREALAEHVVYCKRLDRVAVPFLGALYKLITGSKLSMPKAHLAIVKYGDQQNSMTVDRWTYTGSSLYSAYDTKQAFSDFYEHGVYSLLTPWLSKGRYMVPRNGEFYMRLTRIYFKKYSKAVLLSVGLLVGSLISVAGFVGVAAMYSSSAAVAQEVKPVESEEKDDIGDVVLTPDKLFKQMKSERDSTPVDAVKPEQKTDNMQELAGCVVVERYCRCYTRDGQLLKLARNQCEKRSKQLFSQMLSYKP